MKYIKTFENIDYDKKLIFLEDAFVEVKEISALFKIEHIFFETNTSKKKDYLSKYNASTNPFSCKSLATVCKLG